MSKSKTKPTLVNSELTIRGMEVWASPPSEDHKRARLFLRNPESFPLQASQSSEWRDGMEVTFDYKGETATLGTTLGRDRESAINHFANEVGGMYRPYHQLSVTSESSGAAADVAIFDFRDGSIEDADIIFPGFDFELTAEEANMLAEYIANIDPGYFAKCNTFSFVYKAHGWMAELEDGWLSVRTQKYEGDPCDGQHLVISAFFKACEYMQLCKDGEISHSGGSVRCKVRYFTLEEILAAGKGEPAQ